MVNILNCFGGTPSHNIFRIHVQIEKQLSDICRKSIILTSSFPGIWQSITGPSPVRIHTNASQNWSQTEMKSWQGGGKSKSPSSCSVRMNNQYLLCDNWNILISNCDEERLWVCVMLPPPPLLETHVRINNQLDMQMSNQLPFPQTSHPLCHFLWSQMSKLECLVDSPSSSSCENQ